MKKKFSIKRSFATMLAITAMLGCIGSASAAGTTGYIVPDSEISHEINGKQVLIRTYQVGEEVDPETLVSETFTMDGFDYEFSSITQDFTEETDSKSVRVPVIVTSDSDEMGTTIKKFDAIYPYDEDGYIGDLYLDPQSIHTEVTAMETQGGTVTANRSYTLEYNDPELIPQSITENGITLQLNSVSWTEVEYRSDGSVPAYYIANAVYSRTSHWEKPSEYTTVATYFGTVTKSMGKTYTYTVTYTGTPTHAEEKAVNAAMVSGLIRGGLLAIFAVAFLVFVVKSILYILSQYVKVQAQDDSTGEYTTIQRVRLNRRAPAIDVDVLKAPGSRHFLFTMSEKAAKRMKGKIIMLNAGQETGSHQIGDTYGKEYIFTFDIT